MKRASPIALKKHHGSALLAVLWIIALLTMLLATSSLLLLQDVDTIGTRRQMFRARMLAETGLAIASHPEIKPDDPRLRSEIEPGVGYAVDIIGEDARLNPNTLLQREDRDTLRRIFTAWGLKVLEADALIDAMLDWVDQDDFNRVKGAESRHYRRPGIPFNRPFRSVEEMALVRGMDQVEALFPSWRDWFSVYASGTLDVNDAAPELVSAITGADIILARQFQTRRLGRDGIRNTEDDVPAPDLQTALAALGAARSQGAASILSVQSASRRIASTGIMGDFSKTITAIVQGGQGSAQILALEE
jgi:type II secretory pathway component PulK